MSFMSKGPKVIPEQNRVPGDNAPARKGAWNEEVRSLYPKQSVKGIDLSTGLCVTRADEWEPDAGRVREDAKTTANRLFPAVRACLQCPVSKECGLFQTREPSPHGIYAGQFYYDTSKKKQTEVRAELARLFGIEQARRIKTERRNQLHGY